MSTRALLACSASRALLACSASWALLARSAAWALLACAAAPVPNSPPALSPPPAAALTDPTPAPPIWPAAGSPLTLLPRPESAPNPPFRLYLDAGHGEPGNSGNTSAACESEQDVMLELADDLAQRMANNPAFELRRSRGPSTKPEYSTRIAEAEAWPADLILSLHSDARAGDAQSRSEQGCEQSTNSAGFSVLWGDEVPHNAVPALADTRRRYGSQLALAMTAAGFLPHSGSDYVGLYLPDSTTPGLFLDAHRPKQKIRMLRRPRVPSIILETHNARDADEVMRWRETGTRAAFASAVEWALTTSP